MNILAIESASTVCGVALFIDNKMIDIDEIELPRIHAERLPVIIYNILKKNNIIIDNLDGVAVSKGPGSYTGLRIGMSLAKGLVAALDKPIIPVPTLDIIRKGVDRKGLYWVILHSHKEIVYAQRFNNNIKDSKIECEVFNLKKYLYPIGYNLDSICESKNYQLSVPSSKNVGELAIENFDKWKCHDANDLIPNYVTNFSLEKK